MEESKISNQKMLVSQKTYFMFYNSGSGGKLGNDLEQYDVEFERQIKVNFCAIQKRNSREYCLKELNKILLSQESDVFIIIAGGDGTIMWVIQCLINEGIDVMRCVIIPLPLGTGNDFSNNLGWGVDPPSDLTGKNFKNFKQQLQIWENQGVVVFFDIWDVELRTKQNGGFYHIIENGIKESLKDKDGRDIIVYNKQMSNYASIGIDARIGLGFDRNRTNSKCCNKCVYCWEGFKKIFLKTKSIDEVIEGFTPLQDKNDKRRISYAEIDNASMNELGLIDIDKEKQQIIPYIEGSPASLIFLNINSYSGGVSNIWQNAKSNQDLQITSVKSSSSDGLLEIVTFDTLFGIGNERFIGGNAKKVSQQNGPIKINFKEQQDDLITYFQIDGEYFQVINPFSLVIKQCDKLPNGKIKVLMNRQKD